VKIPDNDNAEEFALNLTPMIDVVFLLLIFFMVATTFLDPEREIEIELPTAESATTLDKELDEIVINVMEDGSVHLSGLAIADEELVWTLKRAAQKNPATPVSIRGDRRVAHEVIVRVLDACGTAGLSNLAVGTLEGS
jgi:biopolymer transport protein ExbD